MPSHVLLVHYRFMNVSVTATVTPTLQGPRTKTASVSLSPFQFGNYTSLLFDNLTSTASPGFPTNQTATQAISTSTSATASPTPSPTATATATSTFSPPGLCARLHGRHRPGSYSAQARGRTCTCDDCCAVE